jgi:transaldolase
VNITLLFALPRYRDVAETYLDVLEDRLRHGRRVDHVTSVASFFLSRMDVLLDPQLERIAESGGPKADLARSLMGKVAVANAKAAYAIFRELFEGERFQRRADQGARPQRLLWASTGTKDPKASDVLYVKALAAPFTVNTMPDATLRALADHGELATILPADGGDCEEVLAEFAKAGIDVNALAAQLQEEGTKSFVKSWNELLDVIASKSSTLKKAAGG